MSGLLGCCKHQVSLCKRCSFQPYRYEQCQTALLSGCLLTSSPQLLLGNLSLGSPFSLPFHTSTFPLDLLPIICPSYTTATQFTHNAPFGWRTHLTNPAIKIHFCQQNRYVPELNLQYSPKVFVAKFFSSPSSVNSLVFTIHPALLICKTTPLNKIYTNINKEIHTYEQSILICCFLTLQSKATHCSFYLFNKT